MPAASGTTRAGGGVSGTDFVDYARAQLGDPYVWAAEGPDAFDCSGLVDYVARHFGLSTPRTTSAMMGPGSNLIPITRAQLAPGDLVFSNWTGQRSSHVGIYAGNNQLIEAPSPGQNVKVTALGPGYWSHTDAYRRIPGVDGAAAGKAIQYTDDNPLTEAAKKIAGFIPDPSNLTDAVGNIGSAMISVAESAAGVGNVAAMITRAFLPSNILRGTLFFFGTIFILIGIFFLASEVRDAG